MILLYSHNYIFSNQQLRVWNKVLSVDDVKRNMWRDRPDSDEGLVALYIFDGEGVKVVNSDAGGEQFVAMDRTGGLRSAAGLVSAAGCLVFGLAVCVLRMCVCVWGGVVRRRGCPGC